MRQIVRQSSRWGRPRRGLGSLGVGPGVSARTQSNAASGFMTSAAFAFGAPAAIGSSIAFLKGKDEATITRWGIIGGLIGMAIPVVALIVGAGALGGVALWASRRVHANTPSPTAQAQVAALPGGIGALPPRARFVPRTQRVFSQGRVR